MSTVRVRPDTPKGDIAAGNVFFCEQCELGDIAAGNVFFCEQCELGDIAAGNVFFL